MAGAWLQLLAASALLHGVAAVTPIEKVTTMLEDLQTQVIMEGKAEAKTYDKFACFCKELTEEKTSAIADGQATADDLNGKLEVLMADRQELADEVKELSAKIDEISKLLDEEHKKRLADNAEFLRQETDLRKGEDELVGAEKELKAKMSAVTGASLVQQAPKVAKAAAQVSKVASALPQSRLAKSVRKLAMLLAEPDDETIAFHSGDIIETIEDLEGDFHSELEEVREAERKSVLKYKKLRAAKETEKQEAEQGLELATKSRNEKTAEIGKDQQDLTTTAATLADDKAYIQELSAKCNAKSKEWDQRSAMRTDEITAITSALHAIGTIDKEKEGKAGLVQIPRVLPVAEARADSAFEDESEVDEIMETEDGTSFVQITEVPRKKIAALASGTTATGGSQFLGKASMSSNDQASLSTTDIFVREQIVNLLASKGRDLKSAALSSLAATVSADPFVKIKKLVQELIERLLQEAADEASHKGWCDKELGKAKQKREMKAEEIRTLNTAMMEDEAKRDKLEEEIATLEKEMDDLKAVLDKASKERSAESAENAATVEEAEEGKAAIEQAIDVLSKFYKTAEKAAALVETASSTAGVDEDMPDSGPKGVYKGSQGASTGVLGMLDVIKSDFERQKSEAEQAEKKAIKDHLEFETTTKSSLGTKKVGTEARKTELEETRGSLDEAKTNLVEQQTMLDKSLAELIDLQPACIDTGMSYAEKTGKREQEIESLKQALCILGSQGPVQTEPGC